MNTDREKGPRPAGGGAAELRPALRPEGDRTTAGIVGGAITLGLLGCGLVTLGMIGQGDPLRGAVASAASFALALLALLFVVIRLRRRGAASARSADLRSAALNEEAALRRRAEERFRAQSNLFESFGDALVTVDLDYRITMWNRKAEEIYGYRADEVMGKPTGEITGTEIDPEGRAEVRGRLNEEGRWTGILRQRKKDGTPIRVQTSVTPVRNDAGEPTGYIGINRDVTDQVRFEENLAESEERFRGAFENSAVGMAIVALDGRFLTVNRSMTEMLGYSEEELLAFTITDIEHPDDIPPSLESWLALLDGRTDVIHRESRYLRNDGSVVDGELVVSLVRDGRGEPVHAVAQWNDITSRRGAERALYESEARFRRLTESSRDIIFRYRMAGKMGFDYVSPAVRPILGYLPEELLRDDDLVRSLVSPEKAAEFREALDRPDMTESPVLLDVRAKDGSHRRLEISIVPAREGGGRILAVEGIARDATERSKSEAALRSSEKKYRNLHESLMDGFVRFDREGRIVETNEAFRDLVGYDEEELSERTHRELTPERWRIYERTVLVEHLSRRGHSDAYEKEYRRKDGTTVAVELRVYALEDADGREEGAWAIVRDISGRKRAEERLRESQRRLAAAQRIAKIGSWEWDLVAGETRWSDEVYRIYDLPRQSPSYDLAASRVHPDDLGHWRKSVERALASGSDFGFEFRLLLPEDRVVWIRNGGEVTRDDEGKAVRLFGTAQDITESVVMREEARAERDRAQSYLEIAGVLMVALDREGTVTLINERGCQILGLPKEEILGKEWFAHFLPHPFRDMVRAEFARLLHGADRELQFYENPVLAADGTEKMISWQNRLLFDGDGRVAGTLSSGEDVTKQRRAEAERSEALERFRLAAHCASDLIYEWDTATDRLSWYGDIDRVLGFEPGELPHTLEAWIGRIHPEDLPRLREEVRIHRESGDPIDTEYRIRRKNGEWLIWTDRGGAVLGEDGRPLRLIGVCSDVTERRAAEEELRKLKLLSDHAGYGVAIADLDGNLTYVNDYFAHVHGYTPEELIGRHHDIFHTPEQRARVGELNERLFEAGVYNAEEVGHVDREGRKFPMLMNGVLVRDEEGNPLYFGATATDMSALKEAEKDRLRLVTAVEQSGDIVLILDLEGRIQYANRALTTITGFPREEAIGRDFSNYVDAGDPRGEHGEFLDAVESVRAWRGRFVGKKRGGRIEAQATLSPIRDDEGRVAHYVVVIRDVSEITDLERRLRQSQKMEAIGTLAGGIAHDFNNVLYAILGFAELALDDAPADSKCHECIEQVHDAGVRASEMVNRILTFTRQREEKRAPLRIQTVVREVLDLLRGTMPATVEFRERIDDGCPPVLADPTEIHQVVMNLCTNASHAMKEGGGVLGLRVRPRSVTEGREAKRAGVPAGPYVEIEVVDTGCGMEESVRERIFDPYFTTKPLGEGTGMGLATVHGIVSGLGGRIRVKSRPGEGTTVRVLLPAQGEPTAVGPVPEGETAPGGNETILFVDDEPAIVGLARSLLERYGYTVHAYTDPRKALDDFRADPACFDLIITDQTMKGLIGTRLAREARKIRPDVPVILCSGVTSGATERDAEAAGIDMFLQKPLESEGLARAVRRALRPAAALKGE